MKNILILCLLILISQTVQAQQDFTIEGKIKGLEDGAVVTLCQSEGRLMVSVASDTVQNGVFHFKYPANSDSPECWMLDGKGDEFPPTWLDVWVAPGAKIQISGNDKLIRAWKVESNITEQQELNLYANATRSLEEESLMLSIKERKMFMISKDSNNKDEDKELVRKQLNRLRTQRDSIEMLITRKEIAIMQQAVPGTTIWMDKLETLSSGCRYVANFTFKKEVIALYNQLSQQQKESISGKVITQNIYPPQIAKVGDKMADADLYDLQGDQHHLNDFKGKIILLDFWSCGCGPCIMSIPELKELSEEYKDNLHVISISEDNEKKWKQASERHAITWNNWNDLQGNNGIFRKYDVRGIPFYVVISSDGKVLQAEAGYSKGRLKRNLSKWMELQYHTTTLVKSEKGIIVHTPTEERSNNSNILIKKVELTDTATIVHIKAFQIPAQWIKIVPKTYLKATGGEQQYPILKAEGITIGKEFYMPQSGEAEFSLSFAPLPMDTKSFDFMEGSAPGDWQLYGVSLSEKK